MRERRCEGTAAAPPRAVSIFTFRPLVRCSSSSAGSVSVRRTAICAANRRRPSQLPARVRSGGRTGGLPPPGRRAVRQKKSTLGRDSGKGRGREGRAHLPCPSGGVRARPRPRPVKDAVDRSPALRPTDDQTNALLGVRALMAVQASARFFSWRMAPSR